MVGIQFSEMANSPLVQSALDETRKSSPEVGAFLELMGANPFQYVEEVLITGRLDSGSANNEPKDVVIFARGNFEDGAFAGMLCGAACRGETYQGHQIFPAKGSGEPRHFVALDGRYGALGELADVREVVDRYSTQTRPVFTGYLRQSIERLSDHHIWISANGPFNLRRAAALQVQRTSLRTWLPRSRPLVWACHWEATFGWPWKWRHRRKQTRSSFSIRSRDSSR